MASVNYPSVGEALVSTSMKALVVTSDSKRETDIRYWRSGSFKEDPFATVFIYEFVGENIIEYSLSTGVLLHISSGLKL